MEEELQAYTHAPLCKHLGNSNFFPCEEPEGQCLLLPSPRSHYLRAPADHCTALGAASTTDYNEKGVPTPHDLTLSSPHSLAFSRV